MRFDNAGTRLVMKFGKNKHRNDFVPEVIYAAVKSGGADDIGGKKERNYFVPGVIYLLRSGMLGRKKGEAL